jgi:hypothetical protein
VLASGLVLAALGLLLLLTMNLPAWLRVAASVSWALIFLRESLHLGHNYSRFDRVRFDASGRWQVRDASGDWHLAELRTGSLLLQRFGWLRLRIAGAGTLVELCRGDARTNRDWRRLQVLWRHVGAPS